MKYFIVLVIVMISNTFLGVAKPMKNQAEIYLAGGCFWGTEHFLKQIRGVESTQVDMPTVMLPIRVMNRSVQEKPMLPKQ